MDPVHPCTTCHKAENANSADLSRRGFLTKGTLAAVTLLLSSAECSGPSTGTKNVHLTITVSDFAALATVGGIARVDGGSGTPVAAVRTGASTFAAFSLVCPHFGCTVGVYNGVTPPFQCPCHGAEFSSNGHWYGGQSTGNLSGLTTSYDATTGILTIT